jgi:hypothetical protein
MSPLLFDFRRSRMVEETFIFLLLYDLFESAIFFIFFLTQNVAFSDYRFSHFEFVLPFAALSDWLQPVEPDSDDIPALLSLPVVRIVSVSAEPSSLPAGRTAFLSGEPSLLPVVRTAFLSAEPFLLPVDRTVFLSAEPSSLPAGRTVFSSGESLSCCR